MNRIAFASVLASAAVCVALASPPALALDAADLWARVHRTLWPPKPSTPTPRVEAPTHTAPQVTHPSVDATPLPKAAPSPMPTVSTTTPTPSARTTNAPAKSKPDTPRVRSKWDRKQTVPTRADAGPNLPYPCWLVRMHAAGKSEAELDALARKHKVKLSPKQERQARACLRN